MHEKPFPGVDSPVPDFLQRVNKRAHILLRFWTLEPQQSPLGRVWGGFSPHLVDLSDLLLCQNHPGSKVKDAQKRKGVLVGRGRASAGTGGLVSKNQ